MLESEFNEPDYDWSGWSKGFRSELQKWINEMRKMPPKHKPYRGYVVEIIEGWEVEVGAAGGQLIREFIGNAEYYRVNIYEFSYNK